MFQQSLLFEFMPPLILASKGPQLGGFGVDGRLVLFQIGHDLVHGLIARLQLHLHHLLDDLGHGLIGRVAVLADRPDDPEGALEHLLERVLAFGVFEGNLAREHVVEHAAQKVDVGSRVALAAAAGSLQRRVIDRSLAEDAGVPRVVIVDGRQAEIDKLGDSGIGDQDVGRLEVAVRDTLVVRVFESAGKTEHQRQGLLVFETDAELEELAEVHPLNVFHDHVVAVVLRPLIVELNDIGVPQHHPGLGLLVKPHDGIGQGDKALPQDLDGGRRAVFIMLPPVNAAKVPSAR